MIVGVRKLDYHRMDGNDAVVMDEQIESYSHYKNLIPLINLIYAILRIIYAQYWTFQITAHLSITRYSTDVGVACAKLKFLSLTGVELNRPFHPNILRYKGTLDHRLKDVHIEYDLFEPKSSMMKRLNLRMIIKYQFMQIIFANVR